MLLQIAEHVFCKTRQCLPCLLDIHAGHHLHKEEDVMLHRSLSGLLPFRLPMVLLLTSVALICESANADEKQESPNAKAVSKEDTKDDAVRLLEKAFGPGCEEVRRPIQIWIPDIGIVVAAKEFSVTSDKRVRLTTISFAMFQDKKAAESLAESNLFRGDEAILTLDRPVSQWSELRKRHIITMEVRSKQSGFT